MTKYKYFKSAFECDDLEEELLNHDLVREFSKSLSTPVNSDYDDIDYIPTQYLTEYIKNLGYYGIKFKSSLSDGENITLFSENQVEITDICLYKAEDINYEFSKIT